MNEETDHWVFQQEAFADVESAGFLIFVRISYSLDNELAGDVLRSFWTRLCLRDEFICGKRHGWGSFYLCSTAKIPITDLLSLAAEIGHMEKGVAIVECSIDQLGIDAAIARAEERCLGGNHTWFGIMCLPDST